MANEEKKHENGKENFPSFGFEAADTNARPSGSHVEEKKQNKQFKGLVKE